MENEELKIRLENIEKRVDILQILLNEILKNIIEDKENECGEFQGYEN